MDGHAAVTVDLARLDDVPRMAALANAAAEHGAANFATEPEPIAAWREAWTSTQEAYPWLVARDGATTLGFAKAGPHKSRGAYAWTAEVTVYVDGASHGRGVGTALYRVLIPTLRAQGFVTLIAGITTPNAASERLHAAFGFVRCGTYHRAGWKLGAWHDVGYWECHLESEGAPPGPRKPVRSVLSQ